MVKAKQVVSVLAVPDPEESYKVLGLRCLDANNELKDVDIGKITDVCMSTIWHIEREFLKAQGDVMVTKREMKSGKLVEDLSEDEEFVTSVIKLLQYDKAGMSPTGSRRDSCFHVTGTFRENYRDLYDFEGYILAPNRSPARQMVMAYYMQTRNLGLADVRVDIITPVKMQKVFTPTLKYHEIKAVRRKPSW